MRKERGNTLRKEGRKEGREKRKREGKNEKGKEGRKEQMEKRKEGGAEEKKTGRKAGRIEYLILDRIKSIDNLQHGFEGP